VKLFAPPQPTITTTTTEEKSDDQEVVPDVPLGGPWIASVHLLPKGTHVKVQDDHNLTRMQWDQMTVDTKGVMYSPPNHNNNKNEENEKEMMDWATTINTKKEKQEIPKKKNTLALTQTEGRAAFQL
jgi:hypothetical protein